MYVLQIWSRANVKLLQHTFKSLWSLKLPSLVLSREKNIGSSCPDLYPISDGC